MYEKNTMSLTEDISLMEIEDVDDESSSSHNEDYEIQSPTSIENENFLQGKSVDEYCDKIMGIIKLCQKHSSDLQGWQNYSDFSGVYRSMFDINKQLNNLISKIFIHQDVKLNINGFKLAEQFDIIKEGNDALRERINSDLDEASGIKRKMALEICDTTIRTVRGPTNQTTGREVVLIASRNVQKPQMFFSPKINNSPKEPFIPVLKEKPNSMKPLSIMLCIDTDEREYYSHPYEYELQHWSPSNDLLKPTKPIKPSSLVEPFVWVDTEEGLQNMVDELKKVKEIAVDVEHHSFRSYQGLTCLIQISTRKKDYIVDPFPLRNQLPLLNEVFTDPKISKVLHGADHDVEWLQRDCGVYIVNMFDTHQAAIILEYPHKSLSYLLCKFCSLEADKTYQRSDWRIRPLPESFAYYARQDTHYLLYIYDVMRNELIEKGNELNNLLCATYNRSTELCMKRYEKPIVGNDSHMDMYRKSKKLFNCRQLNALQQIYQWRDRLARQHDESVDYVLPKHMMMQIAELLPKEMQGILACCNPIPTFVKTEQLTLHQIIRAAREIPLSSTNIEEDTITMTQVLEATDQMSTLDCRYDLSLIEEDSKGLSTLLNPQETLLGDLFNPNPVEVKLLKKSVMFGTSQILRGSRKREMGLLTDEFMSPFERFNITVEETERQEQKELKKKQKKQKEVEVANQARVDKIKSLFKSLSSGDDVKFSEEVQDTIEKSTSDKARMERLQSHIASLTSNKRESTTNGYEEDEPGPSNERKLTKKEKRKQNGATNKTVKNSLKRRSGENGDDISTKKLKVQIEDESDDSVEKDEVEEGEVEDEMEEGELKEDDDDDNEEDEDDNNKEDYEEITPFDYSKANYSVFKPKNQKKFQKQNIKEKYKRGKSKTMYRKASAKSMNWGGKKK